MASSHIRTSRARIPYLHTSSCTICSKLSVLALNEPFVQSNVRMSSQPFSERIVASSGIGASGSVGIAWDAGKDGGALGGGGGQACGRTRAAFGMLAGGIMWCGAGACGGSMFIAGAMPTMPDTNDHEDAADSQPHGATQRTDAAYALAWSPSTLKFMSDGKTPSGVPCRNR